MATKQPYTIFVFYSLKTKKSVTEVVSVYNQYFRGLIQSSYFNKTYPILLPSTDIFNIIFLRVYTNPSTVPNAALSSTSTLATPSSSNVGAYVSTRAFYTQCPHSPLKWRN